MSDADFEAALGRAIAAGLVVERYRYLCLSHPDPRRRAAYRAEVLRLAGGVPAAAPAAAGRPTVRQTAAAARLVKACPYRSTDSSCGCSGARCALDRRGWVAYAECIECVVRYGGG